MGALEGPNGFEEQPLSLSNNRQMLLKHFYLHGTLHGTFTDLHGLRLFQLTPKRVSGDAQKRVLEQVPEHFQPNAANAIKVTL